MPAIAVAQLPPRQIVSADGAEKAIPRESVFGEKDTGFSGWSRCKARLDGRLSDRLTQMFQQMHGRSPYDYEAKLAQWTLHDLRRTIATWLSEHGELPHIVEALLNHISGEAKRGVAGTYNRALYRDQKRAALSQWAAHISEIVGKDAGGACHVW